MIKIPFRLLDWFFKDGSKKGKEKKKKKKGEKTKGIIVYIRFRSTFEREADFKE